MVLKEAQAAFQGGLLHFEKTQHIVDQVCPLLYCLFGAYPWAFYFGECKSLMWKIK
jgi:hypothetical protein